MRKQYTADERQEALDLLEQEGIWSAVAKTGVHHTTVYRWNAEYVRSLKQSPEDMDAEVQVGQAMRAQLRQRFMQVALAHVDRSDAAQTGREAQAYATAAAILHDKFRLEMGEATGRVEVEQRPSRVVEEKLDDLAERRQAKG